MGPEARTLDTNKAMTLGAPGVSERKGEQRPCVSDWQQWHQMAVAAAGTDCSANANARTVIPSLHRAHISRRYESDTGITASTLAAVWSYITPGFSVPGEPGSSRKPRWPDLLWVVQFASSNTRSPATQLRRSLTARAREWASGSTACSTTIASTSATGASPDSAAVFRPSDRQLD